eukprot:TRINITY_DN2912_c0_g1_i8.p1 TRINITY_DN2912_c0_g1~~TRINITY_DN2912_c0_g1_i8.p1  ORF type:complete len:582 (-),score=152.47 TRINITY_DN2912_c0_g1_i8:600-2345(-)
MTEEEAQIEVLAYYGANSLDFERNSQLTSTYLNFLESLESSGNWEYIKDVYTRIGKLNPPSAGPHYLRALLHSNPVSIANTVSQMFFQAPVKDLHVVERRSLWYLVYLAALLFLSIVILKSLLDTNTFGILGKKEFFLDQEQSVSFKDVKGNHEAKEELKDLVAYLKDPKKFANVKVPKGVLMAGPPGTGKTLLARALAGETQVPFLLASGSEFEEVFVCLGARRMRKLFEEARAKAPCIIFIDEIDAIGSRREMFQTYHNLSLNQLLVELDGFTSRDGIILIGATNMPDKLDEALVRPGRFDRKVFLSYPEPEERQEILEYYLSKHKIASDVSLRVLSQQTAGMSGADLENMVNWAALEAIKSDKPDLTMELLEKALFNIAMGREKKSTLLSDNIKKITAYHEGGHALVALKAKGAPEIRKATLMPRGNALGMVNYLPSEEKMETKLQLMGRMQMAMGGRAAEELIFGKDNVTTGASSDFKGATRIAYQMVTKLGMSPVIGHLSVPSPPTYYRDVEPLELADAKTIDCEVSKLVEESYESAKGILQEYNKELHLLAEALLKYETLDKEEIIKIINGEPQN